jgi:diguanylate cyclase (GGDEF)-like protein
LRARQGNLQITVAYIDINCLKQVNDTYGHKEGDWYIYTVAAALRDTIGKTDIVGRLGGDEFAIVFADCPLPIARDIVEGIARKLEAVGKSVHKPYAVTFSSGIIAVRAVEGITAELLLEFADQEMYKDKRTRYG